MGVFAWSRFGFMASLIWHQCPGPLDYMSIEGERLPASSTGFIRLSRTVLYSAHSDGATHSGDFRWRAP